MPSDEWEETLSVALDYLSVGGGGGDDGGAGGPLSPPSPPSYAMRLLGRDMARRHSEHFRSLALTFLAHCGPDPCVRLRAVMEELVGDGHLNWGRVVSLFAFTKVLLREMLEDGRWERPDLGQDQRPLCRRFATTIADFLGEDRKQWLRDNGGWEGLCKYHSERCHQPSSVKTALFAAAAGMGLVGLTFLLR